MSRRAGKWFLPAFYYVLIFIDYIIMYTNDQNKKVMGNKKNDVDEKTLESWARKELFDDEVEGFLQYCDDKLLLSRSKMMTKQRFQDLMASLGY